MSMTTEQLPDGLRDAQWFCAHANLSGFAGADEARSAHDAIRAEHHQRVTLQHHAADQAQRIADLEAERDAWKARAELAESKLAVMIDADEPRTEQLRAARKERDELCARLAEIEAQAAEIERLRAALNTIATHFDSSWPGRCQTNVLQARVALNEESK